MKIDSTGTSIPETPEDKELLRIRVCKHCGSDIAPSATLIHHYAQGIYELDSGWTQDEEDAEERLPDGRKKQCSYWYAIVDGEVTEVTLPRGLQREDLDDVEP